MSKENTLLMKLSNHVEKGMKLRLIVKLPTFSYSVGVAKLGFKATISRCLYNRA